MTTNQLLLDAPQHDGHHPLGSGSTGYHVRLAGTADDVLAAQRLRALVVAQQWPAGRPFPTDAEAPGFDDRCDHLIVWHRSGTGGSEAVAACRLLPPHGNDSDPRGAGLFTNRSFGLMPLERLLDLTVEASGACVRADHRAGAAVSLLMGGVFRYLHLTGYRYLLAAVPMELADGGRNAASFWDFALSGHLARAERRCRPREPIAIGGIERAGELRVPPLLNHGLRLGAKVCGPPGYDDTFDAASFLLLLDTGNANQRRLQWLLDGNG